MANESIDPEVIKKALRNVQQSGTSKDDAARELSKLLGVEITPDDLDCLGG